MSRAKKYWARYRRMTDFPNASQNKAERNIGIIVYSLCFLLACGLLVTMLLGEAQTYINYGTSGGDYHRAVVHRPPDMVICPNRYVWSGRMYEVLYAESVVEAFNMTTDHVNMITKKFHSSCSQGKKCPELNERCSETPLASFCKVLETSLARKQEEESKQADKSSYVDLKIDGTSLGKVKSVVLEPAVKNGALQMLWLAIIDSRYEDIVMTFNALQPEPTIYQTNYMMICHYFIDNKEDSRRNLECAQNQQAFWLGTAYCTIIRGSKIRETSSPYIGFTENLKRTPFRYWVGNLEATTLSEQLLTTNSMGPKKRRREWEKKLGPQPLATAVGHYSMIRWTEVAGKSLECQPQLNLRGLSLPLENCKGHSTEQAVTSWYYCLKYQKRPISKVWIYAKGIRKVEKYRSFTAYTQFQVGVGLLSCFVGFSFLQIVELLLNFFKKLGIVSKNLLTWSQIISLLGAIALTLTLTTLDLYWYFGSRYTTIFKQKKESLSFPVVQLCSDWGSPYIFINTSKMAEYNASVNFYLFMRLAGWQITPRINVASKEHKVNGSLISVEVKEWMRRNWEPKVGVNTTCDRLYNNYCPRSNYPWFDLLIAIGRWDKKRKRIEPEDFRTKFRDIVERDVNDIAAAIGITNPTIAQLVEFFSLDPKEFLRCSMKGLVIENCGRFARYFLETGRHEYCLSLQIPREESANFASGAKFDNSFHVSYDSKAYKEHSDYNSYHGTGVEKERERDKELAQCDGEFLDKRPVLDGGWIRSQCVAARSWKIKIAHPSWAQSYIQLQHPEKGLIDHQLHTLNVQTGFSTVLPLNDTRCLLDDRLTCRFPKEEATAVYKAIQFNIWCGCFYCLHQEKGFLNRLKYIVGGSSSCCTPKHFITCLEKYQNQMKWDKNVEEYEKDNSYKIARNIMFEIQPMSNVELLRKMTPANISIWISDAALLKESEAKNLAEWTRMCFKLPCEEKSYTLLSYQNEPTEEEVVNVTIVFDSTIGVGTEEIDRLDPAQLLGILLCSYSVTIGIGVVGLLEVFVLIISRMKGSKEKKLGKTIHEHLVRGLAPITEIGNIEKVHPESKKKLEDPVANKAEIETQNGAKQQKTKVGCIEAMECKEYANQASERMEPTDESAVNLNSTEDPERAKKELNGTKEASQYVFLLIALVVGISLAVILVIYYFSHLGTEYSADIQVSPKYERPSVAMCVDSENRAKRLWVALEKSDCWVKDQVRAKCSEFFSTFIHAKNDQFCFMLDNSGLQTNLDSQVDDLRIEMPKNGPEVNLFVNGLNNSRHEDIVAFFKWKLQDVTVTYNLKAYQQEADCVSEISDRLCAQCSFPEALSRPHPLECCSAKKNVSRFVPKKTCYELHFGVSYVPSKAGEGDRKSLTIRPSSDFLIIYKVKSKHNIPMLISISGGFISSFTEITFLNVLAVTVFLVWQATTTTEKDGANKNSENLKEDRPDTETSEKPELPPVSN